MAYKEPHFDRAGAKAFMAAFVADNTAVADGAEKRHQAAKKTSTKATGKAPAKAAGKAPKKK